MFACPKRFLNRYWQRSNDNRFVVDSDNFWREEFNPRFSDLFDETDYRAVLNNAMEDIPPPFKLTEEFQARIATNLNNWFSGYRFADIPTKNPHCTIQFLSDLYFALQDILPNLTIRNFPLQDDDFNLVTHKANEGKQDSSNKAVDEKMSERSKQESAHDILTEGLHSHQDTSSIENIDNEGWQNNKTVGDYFQSPQNQGVKPTTTNTEFGGVDGVPMYDESPYTTNTTKQNFGESTKDQSNTAASGMQSTETITENDDVRIKDTKDSDIDMSQSLEINNVQKSDYQETLDFNRGQRLQDFYDLTSTRLWNELLARLSKWILQASIATGDYNYNDCPMYE